MTDPALPGAEQAPQGTPPAPQQAPVQQPPAPNQEPAPAAEATQEQIAQWQQQAAQAQELAQRLHQQSEQYKQLQGAYTQSRQQISALTGAQQQQAQPPNPLDQYAQTFAAKGYKPEVARDSAELVYGIVQQELGPLRQQLQQSQAALTGGFQVDNMLNAAMNSNPTLFANPAVQAEVRNQAMQLVMTGQQVEPSFLVDLGYITAGRMAAQQQAQPGQQGAPPPQYPTAQPGARGMFHVHPNFQPQQQTQNQPAPLSMEAQALQNRIDARFKNAS